MFTLAFSLALATANSAALDECTRWLSLSDRLPEFYERPAWRTRAHLTASREGHAVVLERTDDPRETVQLFTIAVPVYRELNNGTLKRLLAQIARQDFQLGRVQVVLIVNNSIKAALDPDDPVLIENKRTVAWLGEIKDQLPFRIEVIDETRGIDRVMGVLRNRAIFRALEITNVDPRRHVVINLDADVWVPADYLARLDAYYSHFALDAVIARRGHVMPPTASHAHFQIMGLSEFGHINHDTTNVADFPLRGYVTPQISARASVVRELGGFGYVDFEEDFDFGRRLGAHTLVMAPDVYVAQSDRARVDGFAAAKRARIIGESSDSPGGVDRSLTLTPVAELAATALAPLAERLEARVERGLMSAHEAISAFEAHARRFYPGNEPVVLNASPAASRGPRLLELLPGGHAERYDIGSYVTAALFSYLRGAERRRFEDRLAFRRAFESGRIAERVRNVRHLIRGEPLDPRAHSDIFGDALRAPESDLRRDLDAFARDHRWVAAHPEAFLAKDEVLDRLIRRYPDFLDASFTDPWIVRNQALRALNDWLLRARLQPEDYPGTIEFLSLRPMR